MRNGVQDDIRCGVRYGTVYGTVYGMMNEYDVQEPKWSSSSSSNVADYETNL